MTMYSILCLVALCSVVVHAQENALPAVAPSLLECYNNTYLLTRDNRLPHNMISLIEIIRKIENIEGLNMDLRMLSVALLHRFIQDGIKYKSSLISSSGIIPFKPKGYKFKRFQKILNAIPGNAYSFPNNSMTDIERCTLHFMLSSSIEENKRDGEEAICNRDLNSPYRLPRSIKDDFQINNSSSSNEDVEMLSPQQIQNMSSNKQREEESEVDPNSFYPDLPPNHPAIARLQEDLSACPVESGVVKTSWGSVSAGTILAAIAAAMEPQLINLNDFMMGENFDPSYFENSPKLNNKWLATLAGDLAEVCLIQGPKKLENSPFVFGVDGKWNSTNLPRWYFLNSNKDLEITKAELRAGIDGLIIAHDARSWNDKAHGNLRLSQILDMYYSSRGVFGSSTRACYRRQLFTTVASKETLQDQTFSATKALSEIAEASIHNDTILRKYSKQVTEQITSHMASSMNDDLSCSDTDPHNDFSRSFVDLTIVLDTTWPFKNVQPMLAKILEACEVSRYNSNFTLISGRNGEIMINTSNTILDFYIFNASRYEKFGIGFNMPKTIEVVKSLHEKKLEEEQKQGIGGSNANLVLFIPYTSSISEVDKEFSLEQIKNIREEIPDTSILFLTYGSKDRWADFVQNHATDLFAVGVGDSNSALFPIDSLISRIKQFPKRLINSQCGSKYESQGSSYSFTDFVEPGGINFYKIHPNYFFSSPSTPKINFQGSAGNQLTVCSSRELLHANRSQPSGSDSCKIINSDTYTIELSCSGASYIHQCQPYYFSIRANATSTPLYNCQDMSVCRFPDLIRYKISYEDLGCTSGVSSNKIMPATIILTIIFTRLSYYF